MRYLSFQFTGGFTKKNIRKARFVREIAPEIASKIACVNGPLTRPNGIQRLLSCWLTGGLLFLLCLTNTVLATLCPTMLPVHGKTRQTCCVHQPYTRNVSEVFQEQFFVFRTPHAVACMAKRVNIGKDDHISNVSSFCWGPMTPGQCLLSWLTRGLLFLQMSSRLIQISWKTKKSTRKSNGVSV